MRNIRVRSFGGMIPALQPKLLPNENATFCENCKLDTGKLRAFSLPTPIQDAPLNAELGYDELSGSVFQGEISTQYPTLSRGLRQNILSQQLFGFEPLAFERVFGVQNGVLRGVAGGRVVQLGVPAGPRVFMNGVTPALRSKHQVARTYCATYVNEFGEEGGIGQTTGEFGCYEGDIVNLIIIHSFSGVPEFGIKKVRLYRSMNEYTTGEDLANKFDTDYHLVAEINVYSSVAINFTDTLANDAIPGDTLLTREFFMPRVLDVRGLGITDAGFMAIAYADGVIKLSERFLIYAYPLRNEVTIPAAIDSMVVNKDTLYVTAKNGSAYRILVTPEPAGPKFEVFQYPDRYVSSSPRSLVATDFGAMYASPRGLVSLTPAGQTLVTQNFILPETWARDYAPAKAAWWNGYYFGVGPTYSWLMDVRDITSGQTQFGKLTTISSALIPFQYPNELASYLYTQDKVRIALNRAQYTWDGLERDSGRTVANYAPYIWRSKTYVSPAPVTFAAAKITFASGQALPGELQFRLYGDGILKYERPVYTDKPFRLPHLYKSMNWHFELIGTAEVHEVHIATSMDDLSMEPA